MKKDKDQRLALAAIESLSASESPLNFTLGEYAHQLVSQEYRQFTKQEKKVLRDTDPEHLHQMRVGTRRLRTVLQIFGSVLELPKAASANRLRQIAKRLGDVRDLDVQIATFEDYYQPRLDKAEGRKLKTVIAHLKNQRLKAFDHLEATLTASRYGALKTAYKDWLAAPNYKPIATVPIAAVLPDLLTPLLSHLLLHPGWLIASEVALDQDQTGVADLQLHDLRKLCKQVRYEAEFFMPFYGQPFQQWVKEVKDLQGQLGDFQDTQVLQEILSKEGVDLSKLPNLRQAIAQKEHDALRGWDTLRQTYLRSDFRYCLHQMLLQPTHPIAQQDAS
jgi:CHAD domain-containing protein